MLHSRFWDEAIWRRANRSNLFSSWPLWTIVTSRKFWTLHSVFFAVLLNVRAMTIDKTCFLKKWRSLPFLTGRLNWKVMVINQKKDNSITRTFCQQSDNSSVSKWISSAVAQSGSSLSTRETWQFLRILHALSMVPQWHFFQLWASGTPLDIWVYINGLR